MIIGITGLKRSGKDTLAARFTAKGWTRYALADPIKEACMALFDWTPERIEIGKEVADERWGISPRRAMQVIGTEVFRRALPDMIPGFIDDFWISRMRMEYEKCGGDMVVPDARFPDEAEAIRGLGGKIVRVYRPRSGKADPHPSESLVDSIDCDYAIYNDGPIQGFLERGDELVMAVADRAPTQRG
jgi:hypothetical protein